MHNSNEQIENFQYEYYIGKLVISTPLTDELSDFYSNNYGYWSENHSTKSGLNIALSSRKIEEWLNNDLAELWTVRDNSILIGYAIALKGKSGSSQPLIWVTQFVIHVNYRNLGVGKRLLFSIWGFSSYFAWGLVTANPYAVRALEKATRRRCEPLRIKKNHLQLLNFGKNNVSYVQDCIEKKITDIDSKINTKFFVDHSDINEMLSSITSEGKPWLIGELNEGWEWFAFTFSDQDQIELSESEIQSMLKASDSIAKEAYGRMLMNDHTHKWTGHTEQEVEFIIDKCNLKPGETVLDIGCGCGRHSIELTKKGFNVTGIDYSNTLIEDAIKRSDLQSLNVKFICDDITVTTKVDDEKYSNILCLYDVIGSYADNDKNIDIVKNIHKRLKPDGYAIISVMNMNITMKNAKNKFSLQKSSKELLALQASNTMEKTGDIFNPDYYLLDVETNIIYRKEIFTSGKSLPKELIVRDRRYFKEEIIGICEKTGLEVIYSSFVSAGWQNIYEFDDDRAKEILLICKPKQT